MKKILVIFFSLLLVFLMVPVLPNAAYAADAPARVPVVKTLPDVVDFTGSITGMKIPGAVSTIPTGPSGAPEDVTATTFHDSTLPNAGWVAIDNDGDGNNWFYPAGEGYTALYSLDGQDGECISSESYQNYGGALHPDNWLISPAVQIPAGKQLNVCVSGQDPSWRAEHYGIYISTTSQTDLSTFTKLYEGTVKRGGGNYEAATVNLSAYAGQTVYLAIRHFDCTNQFILNVDGVGLSNLGDDPDLPEPTASITRIMGQNRYETSIAIAEYLVQMCMTQFPNAIIATGDGFPDALAGSALSTAKLAPILLVSNKVPASVDNALAFIKDYVSPTGVVFILGGTGVVPADLESKLTAMGYLDAASATETKGAHVRFAGAGRFETNLMVLSYLNRALTGGIHHILACDGTNWPDAATASASGIPMLLVPKNGLNADQKTFLESLDGPKIDVIGGSGAVSDEVFDDLKQYDSGARRVAGANRAETAVEVAKAYFELSDVRKVTFAYGRDFPDTISGGLFSYLLDAPILYGDNKAVDYYAKADTPYAILCGAAAAYVLGGPTLVGDDFINVVLKPNL